MEYSFNQLEEANLVIDAIYKGGNEPNISSEPFHKLLPNCSNSGGFRKVMRKDGSGKYAYIVLYTSMQELEWPDYLDEETGVFRYYGDNRHPGKALTDTKKRGNKTLEDVFTILNSNRNIEEIPPFLIFKKVGRGRDIQFLGIAAPGNPKISPDRDLVAFWRTIGDKRFQNYEAYFTILNTGKDIITKEWLNSLIYNHSESMKLAPDAWKRFVEKGRNGIDPLKAPKIFKIPSKFEQLQSDEEGRKCIEYIREFYKDNPFGFEVCATDLISKMDGNFIDFSLTRPWRDGGRDALGHYIISTNGKANFPLKIDFALEAKCYNDKNSVGVRQMSRLISRIRYRQFGVLVTTSYIDKQAYSEIIEDGHPILVVTASDIAQILRSNGINTTNIKEYLESLDNATEFARGF